jgi:Domain of unknown function (DUF4157)
MGALDRQPATRPTRKEASGPSPERTKATRQPSVADRLLEVQRDVGNRMATHLIQASLDVGAVNNPLERDAGVASRVLRLIESRSASTRPAVAESETRNGSQLAGRISQASRRAEPGLIGREGGPVPGDLEASIDGQRSGGRALDRGLADAVGEAMGADLSGVRVHTGDRADRLSRSMQAAAFTTGSDIFFRSGAYQPESRSGRELLAHELTHVVQQGAASRRNGRPPGARIGQNISIADDGPAAPVVERQLAAVIQRRIGFEVETGIPLTKKVDDKGRDVFEDITPGDVGKDLTVTRGKLSPDHIPGKPAHHATATEMFDEWPIIELVTDPVDDNLKMSDFEVIARGWLQVLKDIKAEAKKGPPARRLHLDYFVGLPSAQGYAAEDWDRIAPQATVGVPLDQVGKVLAAFDPSKGMYRVQLATQIGQRSSSVAAKIMQDVFEQYPPGNDGGGVEGVKALLTMMVNHLLCGGDPEISKQVYMKNRSANVMFKTKLSTVRANIVGSPFPSSILKKRDGRTLLRTKLLEATGRDPGEPVFIAGPRTAPSDVSVGDWIKEVLNGSDDKVFTEMKNEWSDEISPDANNEMVIELRQLGSFMTHQNYKLDEDGGLLAFMKKVYGAHQLYKTRAL